MFMIDYNWMPLNAAGFFDDPEVSGVLGLDLTEIIRLTDKPEIRDG